MDESLAVGRARFVTMNKLPNELSGWFSSSNRHGAALIWKKRGDCELRLS